MKRTEHVFPLVINGTLIGLTEIEYGIRMRRLASRERVRSMNKYGTIPIQKYQSKHMLANHFRLLDVLKDEGKATSPKVLAKLAHLTPRQIGSWMRVIVDTGYALRLESSRGKVVTYEPTGK